MVVSAKPKQHKYIYHKNGKYEIYKTIKGTNNYFGSYNTIHEAMNIRDQLVANNWEYTLTPEQEYQRGQKKYYNRIYLSHNKTQYCINNKHGVYMGVVPTIEEALLLRDKYSDETDQSRVPMVSTLDLKTNNPYIENGLSYELPQRLIPKKPRTTGKGFGTIRKRKNHYRIERNGKYYASCITYEQAYFYHQELNKRGWDKKNIPGIKKDYPKWYTWLNRFYIYIIKDSTKTQFNWRLELTPNNNDGKLQHIGYSHIEDALFERDFLVEHDWDYELLVETINDEENPYYNMKLPPYPERKIKNIMPEYNHDKELQLMREHILQYNKITREEMADELEITGATLLNWLKKYDTNWTEFKRICLAGEDPLEYFTMEDIIYTPDLTPNKPKHFKNYVHKNKQSKKNPYKIIKDAKHYGIYPTKEIANKISNELQKIGWTQENRKRLQKKYNVGNNFGTKRNVYPTPAGHYVVRRKGKKRNTITYGTYHTWLEAAIIRELLSKYEWDKKQLPILQDEAKKYYRMIMSFKHNMFGGIKQ